VPGDALDALRNANGTLVLDQPGFDADRLRDPRRGAARRADGRGGLREVFLQTEADGVLKEGLAAGASRSAVFPLPPGTVDVRARLLLRAMPVHVVAEVLEMPSAARRARVFELAGN
jgi:hypothetical protein